jgi:hypothetical protein
VISKQARTSLRWASTSFAVGTAGVLALVIGLRSREPTPGAVDTPVFSDAAPLELASASVSPGPSPENAPCHDLEAWGDPARAGEHERALELAEACGFDLVLRAANAPQLQRLADTARSAHAPARAEQTYLQLRERFAGTKHAARAAFQLGRLSADNTNAARWFATYIRESPNGAFARDARGRLLVSLAATRNEDALREAAQDYLQHHPDGPHARLARSIAARWTAANDGVGP